MSTHHTVYNRVLGLLADLYGLAESGGLHLEP